jgi:DNA polymerase
MRWTERQQAMLREMGIRLWSPADDAPQGEPVVAGDAGAKAAPMGARVAEPQATMRTDVRTDARTDAPARVVPVRAAPPEAAAPAAAALPRGDVAAMDWDALRAAVESCTACGLCRGRRQAVFGVGNRRAHWMIVGEAPGEQEDIRGEPFVGKSGQLLDNMLRAIGLSRAEGEAATQVYIANTIKCRPPGNRNPEPDELARCEPFLVRQLQLVQPRIILAMGRFAVQSLLRSADPIGRLRGRVHHYQGVPLVVTYHPAYLLRNPQEKAKAWDDLCLALATARAAAALAGEQPPGASG